MSTARTGSSGHARPRDEATEHIECYILEKKLPPHAKLPSERDMCSMWNFNRTTLRSAIKRLIVEGKLYNRKGSGTFVAPPKLERDLQDAMSVSEAVYLAGRVLETRLLDRQILKADRHVAQKLQLEEGSSVFYLRRLRVVDGIPVMIEHSYVDYSRYPYLERYDFCEESLYSVLECYGVGVHHGGEEVGITYTTEEEAQRLNMEEGQPVFYLSGVSCDINDRPVEYFKSVVRADQVRFSSVLTR